MGYYNPYRYSGTSGSGNYGGGAGSSYSHGQQGANPWRPGQNSSYGQPYNTNPYQGEYRGQQQGYPGQYPRPPAGKGRGMGGLGGGFIGGGMPGMDNRPFGGDRMAMQAYKAQGEWDRQMEFHQRLLQQRQMEESLGADPGWSWYEPFTRPQMASMPYAQPGADTTRTPGSVGPYGNRGY